MALIEIRDLNPTFLQDFGRDGEDLAHALNQCLDQVARDYGGPFAEMANRINSYRAPIVEMAQNTYAALQQSRQYDRNQILNITVDATIAVIAAGDNELQRYENRSATDWIDTCFRENPVLIEATRNNGGSQSRYDDRQLARRDNGGQRYNQGNSNQRQNTGGVRYPSSSQGNNNQGHSNQRHSGQPLYRGRLQQKEETPVQQTQSYTEQPAQVATPSVSDGSVITTNNVNDTTFIGIKPTYIAGKEQVVIQEGKLLIVPYDGRNAVDYELHRIDRYYVDVMPSGATELELTRIALRAIEETKDNTIQSFVKEGEEPSEEALKKAFEAATSATYPHIVKVEGVGFNPIDVRDSLIETHKTNFEWFNNNALVVPVEQYIPLLDVSNDNIIRLKELKQTKIANDVVRLLIKMVGMIDTAAWRKLHDIITANFNCKMVRMGATYNLDSITAQWSDLVALLKEGDPQLSIMLSSSDNMLDGIYLGDGDRENNIKIQRQVIFAPVNSFDFDLCAVSKDDPIHLIPAGSMLYNAIAKAMAGTAGDCLITLVTLDGVSSTISSGVTLSGVEYYLQRVTV